MPFQSLVFEGKYCMANIYCLETRNLMKKDRFVGRLSESQMNWLVKAKTPMYIAKDGGDCWSLSLLRIPLKKIQLKAIEKLHRMAVIE